VVVALWALCAVWAGVIFWFSSRTGSQIPGRYSEIGHLGEYAIFGTLLYGALRASGVRRGAILVAVAVASIYGITDEFHQHFVPQRTPDPVDWATDTFGAAAGATLTQLTERINARMSRVRPEPGQSQ
jgi:VanZ family protein